MVEVAQQQASNPVHDAAQALPLLRDIPPEWLPPPKIDMPNKLMFPGAVNTRRGWQRDHFCWERLS